MPWFFFLVSVVGAAFTFNAYLPQRERGALIVPSFFAGWLTSELAIHHLVWQGVATVAFVAAGALQSWPGWLGLLLTLASWAGLLGLVPLARSAEPALEAALCKALGDDYWDAIAAEAAAEIDAGPPPRIHPNPFRFRDPRVAVARHLPYLDDGDPRHHLDVYAPAAGAKGAPVLLQVHGGGWVIGNKREQALPLMNYLAARGWVCVAANYRLSPKATFPDHLVDVKRALAWIRENIADHGGDPDFVVVTGGSAGGHLSAMVGLTAGDPEYQPGFEDVDTSVRACIPFYGVYDFTNHFELNAYSGMEGFLENWVMKERMAEAPEAFRRASPMHRIHPDVPPFFVIHGSHDSLASVAEARHFVSLLGEASKAPVAYAEIPGAQHAFEIFHSLRTDHVIRAVARFASWTHASYLQEQARLEA